MNTARSLLIFATMILPQLNASVSSERTRATIIELDAAWQNAVVNGNYEFIEKHTDDSFTFVHAGEQKAESKLDWVSKSRAVPQLFLLRRVSEQSLELHGDVAVVFGRLNVQVRSSDPTQVCYAIGYVHLYRKRKKDWVFLSHVTTRLIEPEHPCSDSKR